MIPPARRRALLRFVPPMLMLLAVALIFRRLVAGRVLAGGDLHTYFFPYWMAVARALRAGRLPLWTPYLFGGVPLLANSQVGALYPLNWPLWALGGTSLIGGARTLHWSLLLHLGLAAVNAYLLARRLGTSSWGAALSGLLYAGSGYLGVHVEHLNQLQGLAWLPLVLLPARRGVRPPPVSVLALALIVLAGHTQMAFIAVTALLVWRLARWALAGSVGRSPAARGVGELFRALVPFTLVGLITAAQMLPTLELSRFSPRSGGLPWREAVSFSVRPWELPRALAPAYLVPPLLPEGVAYLGLAGMALAALGLAHAIRARDTQRLALGVLGGMGVALALGGYNPLYLAAVRVGVPGLVHFRAPARFLALYVLAGALLAAFGLDRLRAALEGRHRRWLGVLLVGLVAVELWLCSERLPHAAATAARAYTDLRPVTAHLVAATEVAVPPPRFLSISKTLFDAGDEAAIETVYGATLSPEALWAYKVAAKQREVLAPNLSLAFAVPAVDGYDGGLLPLRHYVAFSRLLLPEGTLDGRLRENLDAIPEDRWLALLGVQWLITDKTGDRWVDDVVYDRQFQPVLAPGEHLSLGWLPADFTADSLGLLYAGAGSAEVKLDGGETVVRSLPAQAAETARRVRWANPANVAAVTLRASAPGLTLTGASLIDGRTGAFYPLVLSEHVYLAHSGDVKIYERLAPSPRAFFVPHARCVASDAEALAAMQNPTFDPWSEVLLHGCAEAEDVATSGAARDGGAAQVVTYAEDRVVVEVTAPSRGALVLTDAWYPGWRATVRSAGAARASQPRVPLRADLLFRAVPLEAGVWQVEFRYRSRPLVLGALVSGLGLVGLGLYIGRSRQSQVSDWTRIGRSQRMKTDE